MRRYAALLALISLAIGCGGNDSALSGTGSGLYSAPARDNRDRENLVSNATKELGRGAAAKIAEASGAFGFKLIRESTEKGNVVVSPLSVASAISMTLNGAVGETQTQMLDALGYSKTPAVQINEASEAVRTLIGNVDPSIQLRVANSIWAKEGAPFNPEFLSTNERAYGAKVTRLDLQAKDSLVEMNSWVKEATEGKIENIISRVNPQTQMILLNAVYFKGAWRTPFQKERTRDETFTDDAGARKAVPMMALTSSFGYAEDKSWTAVALPYGNGRVEMVVVLPKGKFQDLGKSLANGLPKGLKDLNEAQVSVKLPRFRADYEEVLDKSLQELGIKLAFGPGADFSSMSTDKLAISEVRHKTFIEVDETGTEAAGATSVAATGGISAKAKEFTADRPFLFFIREKQTGLVLFSGAIRSLGS